MNNTLITISPEIMGGTPVFYGTRVPIISFFEHLEQGVKIDEFLEDFPTVQKDQAIKILELSSQFLLHNILLVHENFD